MDINDNYFPKLCYFDKISSIFTILIKGKAMTFNLMIKKVIQ